jgi:hypothetical protein
MSIEALYILRDRIWRFKLDSVKYENISRVSRRFEVLAIVRSGQLRTPWNTCETRRYSLAKDIQALACPKDGD